MVVITAKSLVSGPKGLISILGTISIFLKIISPSWAQSCVSTKKFLFVDVIRATKKSGPKGLIKSNFLQIILSFWVQSRETKVKVSVKRKMISFLWM